MTGLNSGIRSIGLATHSPANTMAIFAFRGTRGSLRSRLTVQAGVPPKAPAGRRAGTPASLDLRIGAWEEGNFLMIRRTGPPFHTGLTHTSVDCHIGLLQCGCHAANMPLQRVGALP
jgi:hypothetical protein